jgi:hypothetical protein
VTRALQLNRFGQTGNAWRSVTITYRRADENLITSRAGIGRTVKDAVLDADRQLKPGDWRRVAVSTPSSIYTDVKRRPGKARGAGWLKQFEGKLIRVEASAVTVMEDDDDAA